MNAMDNNYELAVHFVRNHSDEDHEDVEVLITNLSTILSDATPFHSDRLCSHRVLSPDEIVKDINEIVQKTNEVVTELNPTVTRMLLSHCHWDRKFMLQRYFENGEALYREAHVINTHNVTTRSAQSDAKECQICYTELTPSSSAESNCGHTFCRKCWSEYLKVKIMDDGVANSIACAATDCDVLIGDEKVIELVDDLKAKQRYEHLITNSYVQQNESLRWCPARGCSLAIKKLEKDPLKLVCCHCNCGYEFCFDCGKEYHAPISCDLLEEFETHNRLSSRIKTCPNRKCRVRIEKVEGSDVMNCTHCLTVFCWKCLTSHKSIEKAYNHTLVCAEGLTQVLEDTDDDDVPPKKKAKNIPFYLKCVVWITNLPPIIGRALENLQQRAGFNDEEPSSTSKRNEENPIGEHGNLQKQADFNDEGPSSLSKGNGENPTGESGNLQKQDDCNDEGPSTSKGNEENPTGESGNLQKQDDCIDEGPSTSKGNEENPTGESGNLQKQADCNDEGPSTINGNEDNPNAESVEIDLTIPILYAKYTDMIKNVATAFKAFGRNEQLIEQSRWNDKTRMDVKEFESASLEWVRSCQTLKNSTIFELYVNDDDENPVRLALFQSFVQDLEDAVAELSKSIKLVDLAKEETHAKIREVVVQAYKACELRRRRLFSHVDEGVQEGWWTFKEYSDEAMTKRFYC